MFIFSGTHLTDFGSLFTGFCIDVASMSHWFCAMPPPTQPTIREHPPRCCAQCIKPPTLLHPRPPQTAPGRPERTKHDTSLSSRSTRHQVAPCSLILGPLLAPFWYPWYHHYIVLDPVGAKNAAKMAAAATSIPSSNWKDNQWSIKTQTTRPPYRHQPRRNSKQYPVKIRDNPIWDLYARGLIDRCGNVLTCGAIFELCSNILNCLTCAAIFDRWGNILTTIIFHLCGNMLTYAATI